MFFCLGNVYLTISLASVLFSVIQNTAEQHLERVMWQLLKVFLSRCSVVNTHRRSKTLSDTRSEIFIKAPEED